MESIKIVKLKSFEKAECKMIKNVLLIRSAKDYIVKDLIDKLIFDKKSRIFMIIQKSHLKEYQELYPNINYIEIKDGMFKYIENKHLNKELKKMKFDVIYIPSSNDNFNNLFEINKFMYKIKTFKYIYYNSFKDFTVYYYLRYFYLIYFYLISENNFINNIKQYLIIRIQPLRHKKTLKKVREKAERGETIKVAFFVIHSSVWKYDGVYRLFEKDKRFEPLIVVCPVVNYGRENMLLEMDKTYKFFSNNRYRVIRTYDEDKEAYFDVKKKINPDIVFYTNPYKGLIDNRYFLTKFRDNLTCYVNYAFFVSKLIEQTYIHDFSNLLWRFFHETELHLKMSLKYSKNQGKNGIVTGYPGVDEFKYGIRDNISIWENNNQKLKRVVWAPHHTIEEEGWLTYSNFLNYYNFMLKIAENYKNLIQFSFKPHPLLKIKLYNHKDWGKEKTDEYYSTWENGYNTQLNVGSYIELFNSSDALIHDSGSFTAEYLHCGKPLLFTVKERTKEQFNDFGLLALEQHYLAFRSEDIEVFIEEVVLKGNDSKRKTRDLFYNKVLKIMKSVLPH